MPGPISMFFDVILSPFRKKGDGAPKVKTKRARNPSPKIGLNKDNTTPEVINPVYGGGDLPTQSVERFISMELDPDAYQKHLDRMMGNLEENKPALNTSEKNRVGLKEGSTIKIDSISEQEQTYQDPRFATSSGPSSQKQSTMTHAHNTEGGTARRSAQPKPKQPTPPPRRPGPSR